MPKHPDYLNWVVLFYWLFWGVWFWKLPKIDPLSMNYKTSLLLNQTLKLLRWLVLIDPKKSADNLYLERGSKSRGFSPKRIDSTVRFNGFFPSKIQFNGFPSQRFNSMVFSPLKDSICWFFPLKDSIQCLFPSQRFNSIVFPSQRFNSLVFIPSKIQFDVFFSANLKHLTHPFIQLPSHHQHSCKSLPHL